MDSQAEKNTTNSLKLYFPVRTENCISSWSLPQVNSSHCFPPMRTPLLLCVLSRGGKHPDYGMLRPPAPQTHRPLHHQQQANSHCNASESLKTPPVCIQAQSRKPQVIFHHVAPSQYTFKALKKNQISIEFLSTQLHL